MSRRSNLLWVALAMVSAVALLGGVARAYTLRAASSVPTETTQVAAPRLPAEPPPTVSIVQPTPDSMPSPSPLARRQVTAQRGPITESLLANGRVAGAQETAVGFSIVGSIAAVDVQVGQQVEEGQVLAELDTAAISGSINDLTSRIAIEQLRLQSGAQQARSQQQAAIADAQEQLRQALADQQRVQAGPAAADVKAAEGAVATAQIALDRATSDDAHLRAGPSQADVQAAQAKVAATQASLQRAQNDLATLANGPTQSDIQTAQRDLATAKAALDQAQANFDGLGKPNPFDVQAAQRAVQVASAQLQAAQAVRVGRTDGVTPAQKDAQIAAATAALSDARDRLARLTQPPSQADVAAATNRLDEAKYGVALAQSHLDALLKGPDAAAVAAAGATVQSEQIALNTARQQLSDLLAPPTDEQLSAAKAAIDNAQIVLDGAQARYSELTSHPTPGELATAQTKVTNAQNLLRQAQASQVSSPDDAAAAATLDQDRAHLSALLSNLQAAQLKSPLTGAVVSIAVRTGDSIQAGTPVMTLAAPGEPIVRTVVNAPGTSAPRVTDGQTATVQLDGGDGTQYIGQVDSLTANPTGPGDVALIQVGWANQRPIYGTTAAINIHVQDKPDALLVAAIAVRTSGDKHYVDYLDGQAARTAEVTLGIVNAEQVEIVNGLNEGQSVLLPAGGR